MKISNSSFFIFICLVSIAFTQRQIDTFNILLPQVNSQKSGKPIQLIKAQGGCFDWISSYPNAVSIQSISQPGQSKCSKSGIVKLNHVGPYESSIYISTTNSQTQQLSNIPVRIRTISRIEIIAKSRIMGKFERQDLAVFAYDIDHNLFTSLEGLKFKWQLIDNKDVLHLNSLKDSHLILPLEERKNIEKNGAQSDIIVVKGDNPGKTTVRVQCIQSGYEHLTHQIVISVIEKFDIIPSAQTYILAGKEHQFYLLRPNRQNITLPKDYYSISIGKQFKVSNNLLVKAPQRDSETILKVEDTRTVPTHSSSVKIYSKIPNRIVLIAPEYMVIGEQAKIAVHLYWNNHLLSGSDSNIIIATNFKYDSKTSIIFAAQKMVGTVRASYGSLQTSKNITVVLPVRIILPDNKLILPTDQSFELKAIGGTGKYEYFIENNIATIDSNGLLKTRYEGDTNLTVRDRNIPTNKHIVSLHISQLSTLIPLQNHKQLNKNEPGLVFTIGKTGKNEQFTKCSDQFIDIDIGLLGTKIEITQKDDQLSYLYLLKQLSHSDKNIKHFIQKHGLLPPSIEATIEKYSIYFKYKQTSDNYIRNYLLSLENYGVCSIHQIISPQTFDSQVSVYSRKSSNVNREKFNLRVYDSIENQIQNQQQFTQFVMTPLSTLQWKTKGGPYDWEVKTNVYINGNLQTKHENPIITCPDHQAVLTTQLTLKNPTTEQLFFPVNQTKTLKVYCKYPSSLKISYQKENLDDHVIHGLQGQIIKGWLIPLDNKNNRFYKSNNLIYKGESTHRHPKINKNHFEFDPKDYNSTKVTLWTQSIEKSSKNFPRVSTYFQYNRAQSFSIFPILRKSSEILLYNPKTLYSFNLQRVSENMRVACNGSINCKYNDGILKINTTKLGLGSVSFRDRATYGSPSLYISIEVVNSDKIQFSLSSHSIEIHKTVSASIYLYYRNEKIPEWQYDINSLRINHQSGLKYQPITSSSNSNKFLITGEKSGVYHLTAEQTSPKYLESTSSKVLTVYNKIEIPSIEGLVEQYDAQGIPHYKGQLTVPVDCLRKISLFGGPSQIIVEVIRDNEKIVDIKHLGVHFRHFDIIGQDNGKTKVTFTVLESGNNYKLAIIQLIITVHPIDKVLIYTLDQALINAQFRIIPHLVIQNKILLNSICNLDYVWKTNQNIKIANIGNRAALNATAIRQGKGQIHLQVLKKSGKMVLEVKKLITIHKTLDLSLPTIIGEQNRHDLTTLLLPPNSGKQFDSNIIVKKVSGVSDKFLIVQSNRIISMRQHGMSSIQLQKINDQSYSNFLNVIITDIQALFIQNTYSQVNIELGKVNKLKFYIQDKYGRLFYNNLLSIQFDVISSDEGIFTASIDDRKQFINIIPKTTGQASLLLKLKGDKHIDNLLQIPHDIVNIQVGKIIQPSSHIFVTIGGQIQIQYHGTQDEKWEILQGNQIIDTWPSMRKIVGKAAGQAHLMIGGYTIIIKVIKPLLKRNFVEKPAPGVFHTLVEYTAYFEQNNGQTIIPSMNSTYNHINNNMKLQCEITQNQEYFTIVSSKIQPTGTGHDRLLCSFTQNVNNKLSLDDDQIPTEIHWKVKGVFKDREVVLSEEKANIHPTFWIPSQYKLINLSINQSTTSFSIKSSVWPTVKIIGCEEAFINQNKAKSSDNLKVYEIGVHTKYLYNTTIFQIKLSNQQTGQISYINVKYLAKIADNRQDKQQSSDNKKINTNHGWLGKWQWTDFLIIFMAFNFIIIFISNYCVGGEKYKIL